MFNQKREINKKKNQIGLFFTTLPGQIFAKKTCHGYFNFNAAGHKITFSFVLFEPNYSYNSWHKTSLVCQFKRYGFFPIGKVQNCPLQVSILLIPF